MYIEGGIYIDIDLKRKSNNTLQFLDFHTFDFGIGRDEGKGNLFNGLMFSIAKNPYFLKAIERVVFNSENHFYGFSTLSITGPEVIGSVVGLWEPGIHVDENGLRIYIFDTFQTCNSLFHEIVWFDRLDTSFDSKHYSSLWFEANVFRDESDESYFSQIVKWLRQYLFFCRDWIWDVFFWWLEPETKRVSILVQISTNNNNSCKICNFSTYCLSSPEKHHPL